MQPQKKSNHTQKILEIHPFSIEIEKEFQEFELDHSCQVPQISLLRAVRSGDKTKREPLIKSFEGVIYSFINHFGESNYTIEETFLFIRKSVEILVEEKLNYEKNEKSFYRTIVFEMFSKAEEFHKKLGSVN
jgi:hypothetical protein